MSSTYERINEINTRKPIPNLVEALHTCFFQWVESYPMGGHEVDIHGQLQAIYDEYQKAAAHHQQEMSAKKLANENWDQYLEDNDDDYFADDNV